MAQSSFNLGKWVLYTGIGWFLGFLLLLLLADILESVHLDFQFIVGLSMGFGVGMLQWLLLRKYYTISFNWVVFLIIGMTIPFVIFDIASRYINLSIETSILFIVASGTLFSSYLQTNYLLKPINANTKSWIGFSLIGWLSVTVLCMFSYPILIHYFTKNVVAIINIIIFTSAGPLLGYITGKGIKLMLIE